MSRIPPFDIKNIPLNWSTLVEGWIKGDSLSTLISSKNSAAFEFVQDGLVYKMVWAFEAIRVYGIAVGSLTGDELFGRSSQALTYGTPTVNSALLLQAGLPSRTMAVTVDGLYPDANASVGQFTKWLTITIDHFDTEYIWDDDGNKEIWKEFVARRKVTTSTDWVHSKFTIAISTERGARLNDQDVTIIVENGHVAVTNEEFYKIATVTHTHAHLLCKYGVAKIFSGNLSIDYFGPVIN